MKNDIIWSCNLVLLLLKKRTLLNKIQAMNLNRSAFINFQQTDCRRKFDKLFSRNLSSFLLHLRKVPTSFKRGLQAQRPPLPIDFWLQGTFDSKWHNPWKLHDLSSATLVLFSKQGRTVAATAAAAGTPVNRATAAGRAESAPNHHRILISVWAQKPQLGPALVIWYQTSCYFLFRFNTGPWEGLNILGVGCK